MHIVDIRLTGLAGATPEGGWADELKPEDDLHTIVEVLTDEGLVGVGSAMTSKALVAAAVKLLRPLLIGERADEPARVTERLRQTTFWQGRGGAVEHAISGIDIARWGRTSRSWWTRAAASSSGRTATSGRWRRRRCWRSTASSGSRRRCRRTIWRASSSCAATRRCRSPRARCLRGGRAFGRSYSG